jgi:excinuclease ABC subunit A
MEPDKITVKGAREHNLRSVGLDIPRGQLVCLTGVSGSGKSSFAFDTLFAEGQRRYLESLSAYARQFLGQLAKPDVDHITGLSPAISIQQKATGWNPRSTVGTITQINDYLRVLFARIGKQHCTSCGDVIAAQTREQILARMIKLPEKSKVLVLAPVVRGQKGEYRDLFEDMIRQGYARARVDGEVVSLSSAPQLSRYKRHDIEIVVDRLAIQPSARARMAEAVEHALRLGDGTLIASVVDGADHLLSSHYACMRCDVSFEQPSPQMLSFNSPSGMCAECHGLGTTYDFDVKLLVPNPKKSFLNVAVEPMRTRIGRWRRHIFRAVAQHVGFDLKTPWGKLPKRARDALLYGLGDTHLTFEWKYRGGVWRHGGTFDGVIADLRKKHQKAKSGMVRAYYEKYMRKSRCGACGGARLNAQALAVRLSGENISDVSAMSIREAGEFFEQLQLTETEHIIAAEALKEIRGRLSFLRNVGLDYLALDRPAPTLSGGESQRIRLASQIGAGLVGVLYILDEPSIGLHPRDNERLLESLSALRDMGNTVIVVEHDEQTMRAADHIVDFGPGPGIRGGEVVAQGSMNELMKSRRSVTAKYLRGEEQIEIPKRRRPVHRP